MLATVPPGIFQERLIVVAAVVELTIAVGMPGTERVNYSEYMHFIACCIQIEVTHSVEYYLGSSHVH